ncbi:MAG: phosphoenolpyruvate--protein phosphotransferase [Oscillospiraceae bacterium]
MTTIKGISLSSGIAYGNIIKLNNSTVYVPFQKCDDPENEKLRARKGIKLAITQQSKLIEKYSEDNEMSDILVSYLYMIKDPDLLAQIDIIIDDMNCNAEYAVKTAFERVIFSVSNCESDYLKSRGEDLTNVMNKIIKHLAGDIDIEEADDIAPGSVLVAENITPVALAKLDIKNVSGIITSNSGPASHLAIIARSIQIPAICCTKEDIKKITDNQIVIIDGNDGLAIVNPSSSDMSYYDDLLYKLNSQKEKLNRFIGIEGRTNDGIRIPIQSNIFTDSDIDIAVQEGAEGIGLVRTETLFHKQSNLPSFEKQYQVYKKIVEKSPGNYVVFRTFDLSSDKDFYSIISEKENNPALGNRGIRFQLENELILHDQLKALLMASIGGDVTILLPFVTSPDQIIEVKQKMEQIKKEIIAQGDKYNEVIKIGAMIEIPSAALMADEIASNVDLLSIGTNDLTQFTLAADRANSKVSNVFNSHHPAVLRLISITAAAGRRHHIPVCVCGEMASDTTMIKTLVGLGITQLSVAPNMVQTVKSAVELHSYEEDIAFANTLMNSRTLIEAEAILTAEQKQ